MVLFAGFVRVDKINDVYFYILLIPEQTFVKSIETEAGAAGETCRYRPEKVISFWLDN